MYQIWHFPQLPITVRIWSTSTGLCVQRRHRPLRYVIPHMIMCLPVCSKSPILRCGPSVIMERLLGSRDYEIFGVPGAYEMFASDVFNDYVQENIRVDHAGSFRPIQRSEDARLDRSWSRLLNLLSPLPLGLHCLKRNMGFLPPVRTTTVRFQFAVHWEAS